MFMETPSSPPMEATPSYDHANPQQLVQPPRNARRLLPVAVSLVLSAVIFGVGGYYLGTSINKSTSIAHITPTTTPSPGLEPEMANTFPSDNTQSMNLQEALEKHCVNNSIDLSELPLSLSPSVQESYDVQGSVFCSVPEESYASMRVRVETPDFSGDIRRVFIYHPHSVNLGMGTQLNSFSEHHPVTFDGETYWLKVLEPGPFGISTMGVWVELMAEKRDPEKDTIVRVVSTDILTEERFIDLVTKYAAPPTTMDGIQVYSLDPAQKSLFMNEVFEIAPSVPELQQSARTLQSDLQGISF